MGHPIELDAKRVEELASLGLSREQIAHNLGIATSTLYDKIKKLPEISEAIKRGKAKGIKQVSNALFENAMSGNTTAQIFFLKNRDPERWRDRRETELTGKDGGPVQILPFEFVDADPETAEED